MNMGLEDKQSDINGFGWIPSVYLSLVLSSIFCKLSRPGVFSSERWYPRIEKGSKDDKGALRPFSFVQRLYYGFLAKKYMLYGKTASNGQVGCPKDFFIFLFR